MDNDNGTDAHKEPSFNGRLRMGDFMYNKAQATAAGTEPTPENKDYANTPLLRKSSRLMSGAGRAALLPPNPSRSTANRTSPSRNPTPGTSTSSINRKPAISNTSASSPSRSRATSSSPLKKRSRVPSSYAPPSKYSHLNLLPDAVAPNLIILFIGLNPGVATAQQGHAYAHPSNHFWKLLYSSGITPVQCTAAEDRTMPERFSLGLTNIVSRPSRNGAELSKAEMDEGVAVLEAKCAEWQPEAVCIVGKSIWESIFRVRKGRALKKGEFSYGWQDGERRMGVGAGAGADATPVLSSWLTSSSLLSPHFSNYRVKTEPTKTQQDLKREIAEIDALESDEDLGSNNRQDHDIAIKKEEQEEDEDETDIEQQPYPGARIFVASSTSGLAATLKPSEKEAIWKELGDWCVKRRQQRGET